MELDSYIDRSCSTPVPLSTTTDTITSANMRSIPVEEVLKEAEIERLRALSNTTPRLRSDTLESEFSINSNSSQLSSFSSITSTSTSNQTGSESGDSSILDWGRRTGFQARSDQREDHEDSSYTPASSYNSNYDMSSFHTSPQQENETQPLKLPLASLAVIQKREGLLHDSLKTHSSLSPTTLSPSACASSTTLNIASHTVTPPTVEEGQRGWVKETHLPDGPSTTALPSQGISSTTDAEPEQDKGEDNDIPTASSQTLPLNGNESSGNSGQIDPFRSSAVESSSQGDPLRIPTLPLSYEFGILEGDNSVRNRCASASASTSASTETSAFSSTLSLPSSRGAGTAALNLTAHPLERALGSKLGSDASTPHQQRPLKFSLSKSSSSSSFSFSGKSSTSTTTTTSTFSKKGLKEKLTLISNDQTKKRFNLIKKKWKSVVLVRHSDTDLPSHIHSHHRLDKIERGEIDVNSSILSDPSSTIQAGHVGVRDKQKDKSDNSFGLMGTSIPLTTASSISNDIKGKGKAKDLQDGQSSYHLGEQQSKRRGGVEEDNAAEEGDNPPTCSTSSPVNHRKDQFHPQYFSSPLSSPPITRQRSLSEPAFRSSSICSSLSKEDCLSRSLVIPVVIQSTSSVVAESTNPISELKGKEKNYITAPSTPIVEDSFYDCTTITTTVIGGLPYESSNEQRNHDNFHYPDTPQEKGELHIVKKGVDSGPLPDLFNTLLPFEIRLRILYALIDLCVEELDDLKRKGQWIGWKAKEKWCGELKGRRELVRLGRVSKAFLDLSLDGSLWPAIPSDLLVAPVAPSPILYVAQEEDFSEHACISLPSVKRLLKSAGGFVKELDLKGLRNLDGRTLADMVDDLKVKTRDQNQDELEEKEESSSCSERVGGLKRSIEASVARLGMTVLTVVDLTGCTLIPRAALEYLIAHSPCLQRIGLQALPSVTGKTLAVIGTHCPHLSVVDVSRCPNLPAAALLHLHPGRRLKVLKAAALEYMSDAVLVAVSRRFPDLEVLDVSHSLNITDEAFEAIVRHDSSVKYGCFGEEEEEEEDERDEEEEEVYASFRTKRAGQQWRAARNNRARANTVCSNAYGKPPKRRLKWTHLNFSGCVHLTDNAMAQLADAVPHLQSLELARIGNSLRSRGLEELLLTTPKLTKLDLEDGGSLEDGVFEALSSHTAPIRVVRPGANNFATRTRTRTNEFSIPSAANSIVSTGSSASTSSAASTLSSSYSVNPVLLGVVEEMETEHIIQEDSEEDIHEGLVNESLPDVSKLEHLIISSCHTFSDSAILQLINCCPNLKILEADSTLISEGTARHFIQMSRGCGLKGQLLSVLNTRFIGRRLNRDLSEIVRPRFGKRGVWTIPLNYHDDEPSIVLAAPTSHVLEPADNEGAANDGLISPPIGGKTPINQRRNLLEKALGGFEGSKALIQECDEDRVVVRSFHSNLAVDAANTLRQESKKQLFAGLARNGLGSRGLGGSGMDGGWAGGFSTGRFGAIGMGRDGFVWRIRGANAVFTGSSLIDEMNRGGHGVGEGGRSATRPGNGRSSASCVIS